ncbi:MAG: hypothetical protein HDT47_06135 [Ruminococcaceae bacterium]|nr:hypothetical protein [Oscillospiraceae bacterium]
MILQLVNFDFTESKTGFSTDFPVESVENCHLFIVLTLKTVENSVENVENGFVIRWILERGSGKNFTENQRSGTKNYSVVLVHILKSYEQYRGLIRNTVNLTARFAFATKNITEKVGNKLI